MPPNTKSLSPKTAVLVHGLYHSPAHFDALVDLLRSQGVQVTVPTLHRRSLDADTQEVQAAVDAHSTPPVVLGHSYGGSVITGLTGAAHLLYLAAFVLAKGESAASVDAATSQLRAAVRPDNAGTRIDPTLATALFYADCPPETAARATALLRHQLPGCGRGFPGRQAWQDTPSTYVVCTQDKAVDPRVQRLMARRCTTALEWPTSHSPYLSRTSDVAALIQHQFDNLAEE
ncbi:alpha/beta hydrolase [Umezawaea sp. NPDC059074]|uniref:alpha/beta hydrolase n=1 Tax=Umezawaea sp. NPDC059074 TaxID=3346716 RepID=UPI0036BAFCA1